MHGNFVSLLIGMSCCAGMATLAAVVYFAIYKNPPSNVQAVASGDKSSYAYVGFHSPRASPVLFLI